jgi:hypothetical protein
MRRLHLLLFLILLLLLSAAAAAAATRTRLHSGTGVLLMGEPLERLDIPGPPITIFREPGLGTIATHPRSDLARHLPTLVSSAQEVAVPATGRKGEWIRISYDDAGREGWIPMQRGWRHLSWEEYLKGRSLRLLPGLRQEYYELRATPLDAASQKVSLLPSAPLTVLALKDEWLRVIAAGPQEGWIRWRDDDDRLTISLEEVLPGEK